ncbi:CD59 glycoprotein-like [Erythrolamprus reginae]|uniref:CD59 glycoprotein-like n=1 Tax=Erythrolamprus reginae TaxID=121349 RepID=UPI00396C79A0
MKSLLVTAAIITFALALFFHSGSALKCYQCVNANCDKTVTCSSIQDTCLIMNFNEGNISDCWMNSLCDLKSLSSHFNSNNFKSRCCNQDLCNNVPNVVASKIVLGGSFLLTIVYILKPLFWN